MLSGYGIVDRGQVGSGKIAGSFRIGGNRGVEVVQIGRARAGKSEKDGVFATGLGQPRDIRRAHERKREVIRAIGRLILLLAQQSEWLRVEDRIRSVPCNGAMRLAGIEVAEVSESSASASSSTEATAAPAEPTASTAKPSPASVSTEQTALASVPALPIQATLHLDRLDRIADPVDIDTCQRAHLSSLPGNGHGFVAEVGVAGNRRQSGAAGTRRSGSRVGVGGERIHQAQVFGRVSCQLANRRCNIALLVGLLLIQRSLPRSQNQFEVHCLIAAGCV